MNEVQPIRDKVVVEQVKNYLKVTNFRNYIFFSMGVHSGLRVSDLLQLKVVSVRDQEHINYVAQKTKNRKRKKRKRKKFIIHPDIYDDLMIYIADMDDDDYLFPSRQRKKITGAVREPIHRVTAYKMINGIAKRFGLTDIGVHSLRKTWGYHLYNDDPRNLALLMEMFGHEDMTTTLMYLGITQDAMDDAIRRLSFTQSG
ncbi:tyrosine-type recombinase/integrase [Paenibacillus sp. FSL H8-0317]|uniref:tyrosine-type recombinase/integrase n=1 Tax=unclassified Paenibacillus TaxID=185978 RepID=UPI001C943BDB|nr:tyrosine-type recombinase/integrase [Paenibacillus sp. DR312]QZN77364.1 tyrosine-type recombinase/integrase [Paenibacillus sp. DR312]